ncbi:MAG: hypothetical protein V7638_3827 [Acidobacteriota bacterium]|jgi:hypothetical protein
MSDQLTPAAPAEEVSLIRMIRTNKPGENGPTSADVHPNEVGEYALAGWSVDRNALLAQAGITDKGATDKGATGEGMSPKESAAAPRNQSRAPRPAPAAAPTAAPPSPAPSTAPDATPSN